MWRLFLRRSMLVLCAAALGCGFVAMVSHSGIGWLPSVTSWAAELHKSGTSAAITPARPSAYCWTVAPSDNPGPRINSLRDVAIISANDAWAVGQYYNNETHKYQTLTEHWDGTAWTFVPSPNVSEHSSLEAVSAIAANDVWAVGSYSNRNNLIQTMILHWNGNDWSIVPSPNPGGTTNAHLYDVHAIAANDVWAVGDYYLSDQGYRTLAMRWDGTAWSVVPTPNPGPRFSRLRSVTVISSTDAWAVGDYQEDYVSKTLTMHWDGAQWTHVPSPNVGSGGNGLYAVDATPAGDVWAVGSYRSGWTQAYALRWDGSQWSVIPSPAFGEASARLTGVAALSGSDVWAVGSYYRAGYSQPLTLHWNGSEWEQGSNPPLPRDRSFNAIDAHPAGGVWAVGTLSSQSTLRTVTERLAGTCTPTPTPIPTATRTRPPATPTATPACPLTWTVEPDHNPVTYRNQLKDVAAISANDVWAVGSYRPTLTSPEQTLTMHWDGAGWRVVPSPNPGASFNYLEGVVAISPDNVWAVGYYYNGYGSPDQAAIFHWDGSHWNIVPAPSVGTSHNRLYDIDATSPTDIWAVGSYHDSQSQSSNMLVLRWNGTQWQVVPTPVLEPSYLQLNGVVAISPNDVWAIDSNYVTWVMHWDGTGWSIVDTPSGPLESQFISVDASSSNNVWVVGSHRTLVGGSFKYRTFVERWDGTEWSIIPSPNVGTDPSYLTAVDVVSDSDVWAVGYSMGSYSQALVIHWDGLTWSIVPSPTPESSSTLNAVAAISANDLWAVGNRYVGSSNPPFIARYAERCPCSVRFTDVPQDHAFYLNIRCLACRNIVSGYQCGGPGEPCDPLNSPYYRPQNNVTRGQLAKIVANAAGFNDPIPPGQQTFEDVPPSNPFWTWIERLSSRGAISGYQCGGAGEPCGPGNRPYFRHGNNATRGQISKIVSSAANLQDPVPNTRQTFEDVPNTHPFWTWIERLSQRGIISGYQCGGAGEPCGASNRPYFRPQNDTTRAQMAKIAANTFYPGCQTP